MKGVLIMATIKTMNAQAQLEENGVILDGKWAFSGYGCYKPKRQLLKQYLTDLDGTQAVNRFRFLGGEKSSIPWHKVEQMVYHRGKLAFFKQGNEFRLLPFVANGELNMYGDMTKIKPLPYNGSTNNLTMKNFDAVNAQVYTVDTVGDAVDENGKAIPIDGKAVILFDRQNGFTKNGFAMPKFALQQIVIDEIANRLAFLNINLVNSQGKNIILVKDPKQGKAVERALQSIYESDKSYSIVKSMFDVQVINNDITYQEQALWEDAMSWNNLRLEGLGIDNNGLFNKKERQLTVESSANEEQTEVITDAFFEARKQFVKEVIAVFGDDPDFKAQFDNFRVVDLRIENAKENDTINEDEKGDGYDYGIEI